jgi:hypothetical protein
MQKTAKSTRRMTAAVQRRWRARRAGWLCGIAGVATLIVAAGAGMLSGHAQSSPAQSFIALPQTSSTIPAVPSERPPVVALAQANPPAQESATAVRVSSSGNVTPAGGQKNEVSSEAAQLLNMATALKAAVDKTTKDTLSVTVVRKANEIEQLAHKVRLGPGKS